MALICKDSWDLLCSIKKYHNQFSYSAAQQALQILILQCRIYFFSKDCSKLVSWISISIHSHFQKSFLQFRADIPLTLANRPYRQSEDCSAVWSCQQGLNKPAVVLKAAQAHPCGAGIGCSLLLLPNTLSCILQAKSSADTTGNTSLTPEDVKLFTCYRWSLQAAYPFSCCCI